MMMMLICKYDLMLIKINEHIRIRLGAREDS